jgi:hypothetical protein
MPTKTNITTPVNLNAPRSDADTSLAPGQLVKRNRSWKQLSEQLIIRWRERVALAKAKPPIQLGITLLKAKRSLGPGRFRALLEGGRFGLEKKRAAKLMRIAANTVLRNPQYHAMLPTSENALVHLAELDAATLEREIRIGKVHPAMTEAEASTFASRHPTKTPPKSPASIWAFDGNNEAVRLAERIMDDVSRWPLDERGRASELLAALAEQIGRETQPRRTCRLI